MSCITTLLEYCWSLAVHCCLQYTTSRKCQIFCFLCLGAPSVVQHSVLYALISWLSFWEKSDDLAFCTAPLLSVFYDITAAWFQHHQGLLIASEWCQHRKQWLALNQDLHWSIAHCCIEGLAEVFGEGAVFTSATWPASLLLRVVWPAHTSSARDSISKWVGGELRLWQMFSLGSLFTFLTCNRFAWAPSIAPAMHLV